MKKIDWNHIFRFLFFFIFISVLSSMAILRLPPDKYSSFLLANIFIGFSIFSLFITQRLPQELGAENSTKTICVFLLFSSILVLLGIAVGSILPNNIIPQYPAVFFFFSLCFSILFLFVNFNYLQKLKFSPNHIIAVDNLILFHGQSFILYPFIKYEIIVQDMKKIELPTFRMEIICKDISFLADVLICVKINSFSLIRYSEILNISQHLICLEIEKKMKEKTFGELFAGLPARKCSNHELEIEWDGHAKYRFV